ncbi:DUF445 domain-containing protein [Desulfitobacterium sp. AusDCA]|uniref:DUF445 domain-containing protein n=1 Tax=Desulfitobacterium sp. AusDCA TaxID=3240383 RepID=UPI003DA723B2
MNYRRRANVVLSIVFLLFILVSWAKHLWPGYFLLRLCQFVLEASLVGGIADWFAVTALFRKPLGWPYHTALIPRNRIQLINGIRAMVETELLSESMIYQKIKVFKFFEKIIKAVEVRGEAEFLADRLVTFLAGLKGRLSADKPAEKLNSLIQAKVQELCLSEKIFPYFQTLLNRQEFDQWLDERLEDLLVYASGSRVHYQILSYLENLKERQLASGGFLQKTLFGVFQASDGVNFEAAADSVQTHLILTIRRLKSPENALRIRLKTQLEERISYWKKDKVTKEKIEEGFKQLFRELPLEDYLKNEMEIILSNWQGGKSTRGESLKASVKPFVMHFWEGIKADHKLQETLDEFFRATLLQVVQKEHRLIGEIVQETLEELSDDELNRFIEDKAGNDLQWIRINGSIVGGILGLILFILLNFAYQPLLMGLK